MPNKKQDNNLFDVFAACDELELQCKQLQEKYEELKNAVYRARVIYNDTSIDLSRAAVLMYEELKGIALD